MSIHRNKFALPALIVLSGLHAALALPPEQRITPPITPPWALECWLWEDDDNTSKAITELLDGYAKYDIPARTIIMDAPWATRFNDFHVDEKAYPDPEKFFSDMKARGVHIVLWMTPMVNSRNDDSAIKDASDWFNEAKSKGYLAGGGYQQKWWHGLGGFIDYSNPEAMRWWRGMQQQVLDWGASGWKLDDSALYFNSSVGKIVGTVDLPPKEQRTGPGWMTTREYMDHFYRDEYRHGLEARNGDFITLARSVDGRVHPEGFAPIDAAPVTWVGDQDHAWEAKDEGIEEAMNYILEAARLGYCIIGSDVAGYHGSTPIPANLYIRWAQFSAFNGLFLNGGHGERALWKRTQPELEIVRKFAWLHNELVPYMYTYVVDCHNGGRPLMQPLGKTDHKGRNAGNYGGKNNGDFHYMFGDDFLVAPIHEDTIAREVSFPEGKWRYLFDDKEIHQGPATENFEFPLDQFPVYVREGAIVPLQVTRHYSGFGDRESDGLLTWLIYPAAKSKFTVHHTDGSGDTTVSCEAGEQIAINVEGIHKPHILRVHQDQKPASVSLDNKVLSEGANWKYDDERHKVVIKTSEYSEGKYVVARK